MSDKQSWFDRLYAEFEGRGEAMFAFSRKQVEERGVTWDEFQTGWTAVGAGLHVKNTVRVQFAHRMHTDQKAYLASLPELRVEYLNSTDSWDRPLYRVVDSVVEGKGVSRGQILCDVGLNPPNETTELHTVTPEGEPIAALEVRPVFVRKVWVKDLDGDRTEEAILVDRDKVASELRSLWFWDTPEEVRDKVFGWLDALQEALNRGEATSALEDCLDIRIEPAE